MRNGLRSFLGNPKVLRRNAKLHRLKRKGLTPKGGKAEMRKLCEQAVRERHDPR